MNRDALIAAADKYAEFYSDDARDCIVTDVRNAFFMGAQAAQNFAAEPSDAEIESILTELLAHDFPHPGACSYWVTPAELREFIRLVAVRPIPPTV